jgi:hypothetical protein
VLGRKVAKTQLIGDIHETAASSIGLPVPLDSPAIPTAEFIDPIDPITDVRRPRLPSGCAIGRGNVDIREPALACPTRVSEEQRPEPD